MKKTNHEAVETHSDFIHNTLFAEGTISASELDLIHATDSLDRAVKIIKRRFQALE